MPEGAELAFSYQGEAFGKRVEPLAASVGSTLMVDVDVMDDASMDACSRRSPRPGAASISSSTPIAFSDKTELTGRFINTSRDNFRNSLTISCYSFIRRVAPGLGTDARRGTLLTIPTRGRTG